ncbi:MAG: CRISPR-associated endonuclease Cas2 [Armatimonadota bacterium]|nr:CRISPR-associated endonuclease Cas2 [Armatimonadota bacterium]
MFVIVSYDIPDDRRRLRIAKALKAFGDRVQYSVFECNLGKNELELMTKRLLRMINEAEDSIRIYRACAKCKSEIKILGLGTVSEDPDLIIV